MNSLVRPGWWLMLALAVLGASSALAQTTTTKVSVEVSHVVNIIGDGKIDWSQQEVRARGIGFAPKFAKTPAQITVLAREAAMVAAERNLIKVIYGVHVTSDTTVENMVLTQDTIKTSVKGLLKGAVIVSEKPYGDEGYEVVLAVNLYGDKASIAQSIDLVGQFKAANPGATVVPSTPKVETPKPAEPAAPTPPAPAADPAPPAQLISAAQPGGYTGLVIDCRDLGLSRSMCPRILDQTGANLFGTLTVSEEMVNECGIAGYYQSSDDPTLPERVGKHPIVLKALRVSGGKVFKTDVVLGPADAEFVRAENAKTLFLEKLNVAFLVDKDQ
ncbi:MAG TPA: hypothetical protein VGL77_14570 [Armatimonadota bacterium]|jgi:hypothetical protein